MDSVVDWCAFLGAWLLFAGPIYQAENELDAEALEAESFEEIMRSAPRPKRFSNWWWLVPPIALLLHWGAAQRSRSAARKLLTPEQMEQLLQFSQTATGWMLVGGGAGLIAVKETASLAEHYDWPAYVQWPLVALMVWLSVSFVSARAQRRNDILGRRGRRDHRGRGGERAAEPADRSGS